MFREDDWWMFDDGFWKLEFFVLGCCLLVVIVVVCLKDLEFWKRVLCVLLCLLFWEIRVFNGGVVVVVCEFVV